MLRKDPAFTIVAALTLALGIGANTAIFSVINTVLLRPLPYAEPERLVFLSESTRDVPRMAISLPNLADWQARNTVFESMGGFRKANVALTGNGDPRRITTGLVSASLFPTLGVQPLLGHTFTAEEDKPDADPVALVSDGLWAREFGRDPEVVGKTLKLDGQSYTVVGVMPTSRFPLYWRQMDAFTPLGRLEHAIGGPTHRAVHVGVSAYARLKPGVTVEQARAQMLTIAGQLEKQYPDTNAGQSITVQPLLEELVGGVSRPLTLLMGAVGLVLLIACANVANLLTSRAIGRRREMAVRRALGAGAGRLAGQLLCESVLLALLGGAIGLIAAYCAVPALAHHAVSIMPRIEDFTIDRNVLAFTFALSLLTGIVFGVLPALAAYRSDPSEALQESGRAPGTGMKRIDLRALLAAAELAMALVLLIGAGLTVKSLFHVLHADLGLETNNVLTAAVNLPPTRYKSDAQLRRFAEELVPKLAALPGVTAAGFVSPQVIGGSQVSFRAEGRPQPAHGQEPYSEFTSVTPGALEAMRVKLLSGRFFLWSDNETSLPVCIIDDSLAARYWPGESAIGKRLLTDAPNGPDGQPAWMTVVGVVHRISTDGADDQPLVETFIPYSQFPIVHRGRLIIRSPEDRGSLLIAVRRVMRSIDPELPLYEVRSLSDVVEENVAARRLSVIAAERVRGHRPAAGGAGRVRRHYLHGHRTHPRNRAAPGIGRQIVGHRPPGARPGNAGGCGRNRGRHSGFAGDPALAGGAVVRSQPHRSRDPGRRCRLADCGGCGSLLHPAAPSYGSEPGHHPAPRVNSAATSPTIFAAKNRSIFHLLTEMSVRIVSR